MEKSASAAQRASVITGAILLFTAVILEAASPGKGVTPPPINVNPDSLNTLKTGGTPVIPGAGGMSPGAAGSLQNSLDAVKGQTGGAAAGGGGTLPPKKSSGAAGSGNNSAGNLFKQGDVQQNNRLLLGDDPASSAAGAAGAAGSKMDGLRDKLGLEAVDKLRGTEALSGALGTSGADGQGLPKSRRGPAGAGPAMNLPDPSDKAADGGRVVTARYRSDAREFSGSGRAAARHHGLSLRERTTWVVEERNQSDRRTGVTTVSTEWELPAGEAGQNPERWTLIETFVTGPGNPRDGRPVGVVMIQDDGRGNAYAYHHRPDGGVARMESQESDDGTVVIVDSDGSLSLTTAAGNKPRQGQPANASDGKGGSTGSSGSSGDKPDSGSGSSGSDKPDGGSSDKPDKTGSDKPDKPKDGKSQPVEGGASNRDFFGEMGVTHPGDRPKSQGRGSDDRNIPKASGVIIIFARPRTPEELKRMVRQPGVDGDARTTGGGGRMRDPWRFAQPPPGGDGSGITPSNPNIPGVTGPGTDTAPSVPKPSDPAERQ